MIYAIHNTTKEHSLVTWQRSDWDYDWRIVEADPDGWIEWQEGSGNPLPEDTRCDVLLWGRKVVSYVIAHSNASWEGVTHYRPILDAKPEPPAWDGEGRPPIGEIVMVRSGECKSPGKVLALDHNIVVVRYEAGLGFKYSGFDLDDISPVRSEEDRVIDDMKSVAGISTVTPEAMEMITRALYRAGYRK